MIIGTACASLPDDAALWIVIGTTGFVSAVLYTLNSLSLQEYVARWISDYMTSETGVTVMSVSLVRTRRKRSMSQI